MGFKFLAVLFFIHTFLWITLSYVQVKVKQNPRKIMEKLFYIIASMLIIASWSVMICTLGFFIYNIVICNLIATIYLFLVLSFGCVYILVTLKKYNYSIRDRQSLTVCQCLLLGIIYAILLV